MEKSRCKPCDGSLLEPPKKTFSDGKGGRRKGTRGQVSRSASVHRPREKQELNVRGQGAGIGVAVQDGGQEKWGDPRRSGGAKRKRAKALVPHRKKLIYNQTRKAGYCRLPRKGGLIGVHAKSREGRQ